MKEALCEDAVAASNAQERFCWLREITEHCVETLLSFNFPRASSSKGELHLIAIIAIACIKFNKYSNLMGSKEFPPHPYMDSLQAVHQGSLLADSSAEKLLTYCQSIKLPHVKVLTASRDIYCRYSDIRWFTHYYTLNEESLNNAFSSEATLAGANVIDCFALIIHNAAMFMPNSTVVTHLHLLSTLLNRPEKIVRCSLALILAKLSTTHFDVVDDLITSKLKEAKGSLLGCMQEGKSNAEDTLLLLANSIAARTTIIAQNPTKSNIKQYSSEFCELLVDLLAQVKPFNESLERLSPESILLIEIIESITVLDSVESLVVAGESPDPRWFWIKNLDFCKSSKVSFIALAYIKCLSQLHLAQQSTNAARVSESLDLQLEKSASTVSLYFGLAESIVIILRSCNNVHSSDNFSVLENLIESTKSLLATDDVENPNIVKMCIVLLVTVKYMPLYLQSCAFSLIDRILHIFLSMLRKSNGLLNDLSVMGLSHLYKICDCGDLLITDLGTGIEQYKSVSDFIAQEISDTITKRKRFAQPAGYNSSGRTGGAENPATGESHQAQGPSIVLPPLENIIGADQDTLLEVASRVAAAEANASLAGVDNAASSSDISDNGYGAYSKLCSIARKTGDSAIVMTVMSLVRNDISFGTGESAPIFAVYRHPVVTIEPSRVDALIPQLYLAKFDPINSVRDVMKEVWSQLVRSSDAEVLIRFAHPILNHAIDNLLNSHWREREAACLALETVLTNKSWVDIHNYSVSLLTKGIRVMDDLRESTRKAAAIFMKTFMQQIIRATNAKESSDDVAAMAIDLILPVLLEKGVVAPSLEARGFCFGVLIKIIENSSQSLIRWLEKLVDALIESISAMEPQMMQYLQFHTSSLQLSAEEWEKTRIQLAQNSPMHEALRKCLGLATAEHLPTICRVTFHHLQMGVGLATRVAAANTFVYLAERFPSGMSTLGYQVVQALSKLLSERPNLESSLKKAMMNALGMLAKVVSSDAVVNELEELSHRWINRDSRSVESELALVSCMKQFIKKAGERVNNSSLWTKLLAISFVGTLDSESAVAEEWSDCFASALDVSGTGTKYSAILKSFTYLSVIIPVLMLDPMWEKRKQAVRIVQELVNHGSFPFQQSNLAMVIASMLLQLPGSIWTGQNLILDCLGELLAKVNVDEAFGNTLNHGEVIKISSKTTSGSCDVSFTLNLPEITLTEEHRYEYIKSLQLQLHSLCLQDLKQELQDVNITQQWTVNLAALVELLIREAQRGNNDYRLSGAHCLSLVPWEFLVRSQSNNLESTIDTFQRLGQLYLTPPKPPVETVLASTTKPSSTLTSFNANAMMFGSRYGTTSASSSSSSSNRPKKVAKVSVTDDSTDAASNQPMQPQVDQDSSPMLAPSSSNVSDSLMSSSASSSAPMSAPAYRMYFVICLTKIWAASVDSLPTMNLLTPRINLFLTAAQGIVEQDVWSMRKVVIQLIATICKVSVLEGEQLSIVLKILEKGLNEPKYTQVKLAALEGIEKSLSGVNAVAIMSDSKNAEKVRSFVRKASTDSQPTVLEAAAKLQNVLLSQSSLS